MLEAQVWTKQLENKGLTEVDGRWIKKVTGTLYTLPRMLDLTL